MRVPVGVTHASPCWDDPCESLLGSSVCRVSREEALLPARPRPRPSPDPGDGGGAGAGVPPAAAAGAGSVSAAGRGAGVPPGVPSLGSFPEVPPGAAAFKRKAAAAPLLRIPPRARSLYTPPGSAAGPWNGCLQETFRT